MSKIMAKRPTHPSTRSPLSKMFARDLFSQGLFDDFFNQMLSNGDTEISGMMNVSMDVAETDHAYEVKLDLPGLKPDEVDIHLENNMLTVRGERKSETEEKDENKQFHRLERYSGSFARSVSLPTSINEEETAAEFKDGVLKIVIPKSEESKPRKISIKS